MTGGSWTKREVVDNFVSIGDGEGDVSRVGGILTRIVKNNHYDKMDYEFVAKDGKLAVLSGQATLARQISADDMGKFFKAEFEGWGKSANGKFKKIAVYLWDGEPTDVMKAWPRFAEYYGKQPAQPVAAKAEVKPKATDDFGEQPPPGDGPREYEDDGSDPLPF